MKAAILLSILACALGLPQKPLSSASPLATEGPTSNPSGSPSSRGVNRQGFFGGSGSRFRSSGPGPQQHNWGPKAYGLGLNNPLAFPPNPFVMQRAIALTERVPGTLVRVGIDGEVQITDQHGLEVEIVDWFGNDITEGIEEFEDVPFGFSGFGSHGPNFRSNFGGNFGPNFRPNSGPTFGNHRFGGFGF